MQPMEDDTKTNPHSSSPLLVSPNRNYSQKGKQKKNEDQNDNDKY